jgi:branched-chain amino acid transport system ATP-binding protein
MAGWAMNRSDPQAPPIRAPGGFQPLLHVDGLTKSFGGIAAVRNVTFHMDRGQSVGLVGPNGAGKTTLFNCICGQLEPEEGLIELDGTALGSLPTYKRARLGIGRTYQRCEMFTDMTVREHLLVAERARSEGGYLWRDLTNRSQPTKAELTRVADVLELVGIGDRADAPVSTLGLGLCRLVELARALVADPILLLADEPSSGLDVRETQELAHVLRTLQRQRGMAVLLVEHNLSMVAEVVDRAIVMDLGAIIAEGSFDEVMADPTVRHAYLGISA